MSKQSGMRRRKHVLRAYVLAPLLLCLCTAASTYGQEKDLSGTWEIVKERSSDINPWRTRTLTIESSDEIVTVFRDLGAGRDSRKDTLSIPTNGQTSSVRVKESKKWLEQPHLGVFFDGKTDQHVSGTWLRPGKELMANVSTTLQTSQAAAQVEIIQRYIVSEDGTELLLIETRSSRPRPITLVFERQ